MDASEIEDQAVDSCPIRQEEAHNEENTELYNNNDGHIYIGVLLNCCPRLPELVYQANRTNFDFMVIPLVHHRYRRDMVGGVQRECAFSRSDVLLPSQQWTSFIIGKISRWLDLDSKDTTIRRNNELAFKQELSWANHLTLPAVLLNTPSSECTNYSRYVNEALSYGNIELWIPILLSAPCSTQVQAAQELLSQCGLEKYVDMFVKEKYNYLYELSLMMKKDFFEEMEKNWA